jgi:hypothetical protein
MRRALLATAAFVAMLLPPPAGASGISGLAISVPGSASLGTASSGSVSGVLGNVTVTTPVGVAGTGSWTATVVSTAFTTGGGSAAETIAAGNVAYLSGPVTTISGIVASACTPGQLVTAVPIASTTTAMSCTIVSLLTATSVAWRPTVTVTIPSSAVAGTYTGTITHSVA